MSDLSWAYSVDEIEKRIKEQVSNLGDKLDHIQITWFENEHTFELLLSPVPSAGIYAMPGDGHDWRMTTIAYISKYKDGYHCSDNLSVIREAGRKLYFQLRKKFPLKRDLSIT